MERIVRQGLLYDFYGVLLTEHQRKIYEDVVFNDLSISEIAREEGISRQGVHDLVRRCDKILESYEARLGLVEKFEKTKESVRDIHQMIQEYQRSQDQSLIEKIEAAAVKILELS
ncbi:MAG: YlxM family DNA-binding protein [bacterium]|nr:YlxM family DNA-binding protein [bacterium]